jgi:7-carboxy-7-deazaguanine synthase
MEGGVWISLESIVRRVMAPGIRNVCITGGEPLMQNDTPALVSSLIDMGCRVSVETNGTFDADILDRRSIRIIDVKCPGSGESGKFHPSNLETIRHSDEFKFVLTDRNDYEFARSFSSKHDLINRCTVLLSPVADTLSPALLAEWMIADASGARLNLQLHRFIWPDVQRGR